MSELTNYSTSHANEMFKLERRAVNSGWPITDSVKAAIILRQAEIASSDRSSNRESTNAAKCLVKMESQNIALMQQQARSSRINLSMAEIMAMDYEELQQVVDDAQAAERLTHR